MNFLGKLTYLTSQVFRWIIIILVMGVICTGTGGFASLWGLLIVKFLKRNIKFNISIYKDYCSFNTININEFKAVYTKKLLYNLIFFVVILFVSLKSFTFENTEYVLIPAIVFGFLIILSGIQLLYFKMVNNQIKRLTQK